MVTQNQNIPVTLTNPVVTQYGPPPIIGELESSVPFEIEVPDSPSDIPEDTIEASGSNDAQTLRPTRTGKRPKYLEDYVTD